MWSSPSQKTGISRQNKDQKREKKKSKVSRLLSWVQVKSWISTSVLLRPGPTSMSDLYTLLRKRKWWWTPAWTLSCCRARSTPGFWLSGSRSYASRVSAEESTAPAQSSSGSNSSSVGWCPVGEAILVWKSERRTTRRSKTSPIMAAGGRAQTRPSLQHLLFIFLQPTSCNLLCSRGVTGEQGRGGE